MSGAPGPRSPNGRISRLTRFPSLPAKSQSAIQGFKIYNPDRLSSTAIILGHIRVYNPPPLLSPGLPYARSRLASAPFLRPHAALLPCCLSTGLSVCPWTSLDLTCKVYSTLPGLSHASRSPLNDYLDRASLGPPSLALGCLWPG
jgi:hypothetical protein